MRQSTLRDLQPSDDDDQSAMLSINNPMEIWMQQMHRTVQDLATSVNTRLNRLDTLHARLERLENQQQRSLTPAEATPITTSQQSPFDLSLPFSTNTALPVFTRRSTRGNQSSNLPRTQPSAATPANTLNTAPLSSWSSFTQRQQYDALHNDDNRSSLPFTDAAEETFIDRLKPWDEDRTRNKILVFQPQPQFTTKLERLTTKDYIKFVEAIQAYTREHNLEVPAPNYVAEPIRDVLRAKYLRGAGEGAYYQLANDQLIRFLAYEIRPQSAQEFYIELDTNVTFKLNAREYQNATTEYEQFHLLYEALLRYRTRFMHVYEILALNNPATNIPVTSDKKRSGLIYLFLSKIQPQSYAEATHAELKKKHWDHNVDQIAYKSIASYIHNFFVLVEEDHERSKLSVSLNYKLTSKTSSFDDTNRTSPSHTSFSQKAQSSPPRFNNSRTYSDQKRLSSSPVKSTRLYNVETVTSEDETDASPFTLVPPENEDLDDDASAIIDAVEELPLPLEAADDDSLDDQLHAIMRQTTSASSPDGRNACLSMIIHNTCNRKPCRYSHDPDILRAGQSYWYKLICDSTYRPDRPRPPNSDHNARPPQHPTRSAPTTPPPPKSIQRRPQNRDNIA